MLSNILASLKSPAPNWTWTQLGAATVFVLVVIIAWRQVTLFIMDEL